MACLALAPNELVPTTTLADMTRVPTNYLAKVLQQLATAKLITGRRGVGGGYRLTRPAEQIKMLEVINAVGRLERITTCPLGLPNHGPNLCPLHRALDDAASLLIRQFENVSLKDLIDQPGAVNRPLCDPKATQQVTVSGAIRVRPRPGQ